VNPSLSPMPVAGNVSPPAVRQSPPAGVDLDVLFCRRFKTACEASSAVDRTDFQQPTGGWLILIPCRHGHFSKTLDSGGVLDVFAAV
jgi:hypothetical protein